AQLAVVCDRLGDKAGADKYAQQAARAPADVDWPDPYAAENMLFAVRQRHVYRAVETLEGQKKLADAAIILNRMVERYPDDYRPYLMLGRILPQMSQYAEGEKHLRKARA